LIRLVKFLLLIEKITQYNKELIDKGLTPQKIYELCSCIRETFCLSYSIRKDNNLYLYFQNERILISLIGKALRYLGPDERSQALLLEKALRIAKGIDFKLGGGKKQSTPGIYGSKFFDHRSFLLSILSEVIGNVYFITEDEKFNIKEKDIFPPNLDFVTFLDDILFILPTYEISNGNSEFLNLFNDMKNIKFFSLSKIKQIENKILYINYRKDHKDSVRL